MKRILTMQDISCVGKCSLTVALPVISAMGVEASVIPTAVLSTHTMFEGFTFHDLTDTIQPTIRHFLQQGFTFDAIYTGYLGSFDQLDIAKVLFKELGEDSIKIVDPCMADNGKLYPGFTEDFAHAMKDLCAKADIICPNLTEASFMLDVPYTTEYDEAYIKDVLKQLTALGCSKAILTGISFEKDKLGAYAYDASSDAFYYYCTDEEPEHFHGTGDIWASTLCGALMNEKSFEDSINIACDYVKESIRLTLAEENHNDYGVNFEQAIPYLVNRLNEK